MLAAIDSWIFLLLIAGAAFLRWLASRATAAAQQAAKQKQAQQQQQQRQGRPAPQPASSDEEEIRKFLEALGQPATAKPPPPVAPRTDVAPRPVAPVRPPPSMIPVPELRKTKSAAKPGQQVFPQRSAQKVPPPTPARTFQPRAPRPRAAEAPVFEVRDLASSEVAQQMETSAGAAQTRSAAGKQNLADLLRSPAGLRQAIILREIFGQPRSLQAFEDLPGTA